MGSKRVMRHHSFVFGASLVVFFHVHLSARTATSLCNEHFSHGAGPLEISSFRGACLADAEGCAYFEDGACLKMWPHGPKSERCEDNPSFFSLSSFSRCDFYKSINCSEATLGSNQWPEHVLYNCPKSCGLCPEDSGILVTDHCQNEHDEQMCLGKEGCAWFSNSCYHSEESSNDKLWAQVLRNREDALGMERGSLCYDNPAPFFGKRCSNWGEKNCYAAASAFGLTPDMQEHLIDNCPDTCGTCAPYVPTWKYNGLDGTLCQDDPSYRDPYGRKCDWYESQVCAAQNKFHEYIFPVRFISEVRDHCPASCKICPSTDDICEDNIDFVDYSGLSCSVFFGLRSLGLPCFSWPMSILGTWGRYDGPHESRLVSQNCRKTCETCRLPPYLNGKGTSQCRNDEQYTSFIWAKSSCPKTLKNDQYCTDEFIREEAFSNKESIFEYAMVSHYKPDDIASERHYWHSAVQLRKALESNFVADRHWVENLKDRCPVSCKECKHECQPGTFSASGDNTFENCSKCPQGKIASAPGATTCTPCTKEGQYAHQGTSCALCPENSIPSASQDSCEPCAEGTFAEKMGSVECIECRAGYVCAGGSGGSSMAVLSHEWNGPVPCPIGTWSIKRGSSSMSDCIECPKGHFCPTVDALPIKCPEGTFQPDTGASSYAACLSCPEFFTNNRSASVSCPILECQSGFYPDIELDTCIERNLMMTAIAVATTMFIAATMYVVVGYLFAKHREGIMEAVTGYLSPWGLSFIGLILVIADTSMEIKVCRRVLAGDFDDYKTMYTALVTCGVLASIAGVLYRLKHLWIYVFNENHKDTIRNLLQEIMYTHRISPLEAHLFTIRSEQSLEVLRFDYETCKIEIKFCYASSAIMFFKDLPIIAMNLAILFGQNVFAGKDEGLDVYIVTSTLLTTVCVGTRIPLFTKLPSLWRDFALIKLTMAKHLPGVSIDVDELGESSSKTGRAQARGRSRSRRVRLFSQGSSRSRSRSAEDARRRSRGSSASSSRSSASDQYT